MRISTLGEGAYGFAVGSFERGVHGSDVGLNPLGDCGGTKLANEVGLGCAAGDHGRGPGGDCFGEEEFEFSAFVAAAGESGEIIPFDPDFSIQSLAEFGENVAGGGEDAEGDSGGHCFEFIL